MGSANGVVPSGNKPLHEPILSKFQKLKHWGWDKMAIILQTAFRRPFLHLITRGRVHGVNAISHLFHNRTLLFVVWTGFGIYIVRYIWNPTLDLDSMKSGRGLTQDMFLVVVEDTACMDGSQFGLLLVVHLLQCLRWAASITISSPSGSPLE